MSDDISEQNQLAGMYLRIIVLWLVPKQFKLFEQFSESIIFRKV